MTWVNVGCGPHRAAEPWVNLDCHQDEKVCPDILVDADRPLASFDDGTVERIYLGHVLEHTPWPALPAFLEDLRRALAPGGEMMVVGPDVYRTIRGWRDGAESWDLVESVLEADEHYATNVGRTDWPNARHWWCCHEQRVVDALTVAGFARVTAVPVTGPALTGWPVVGFAPWQCAVRAHR